LISFSRHGCEKLKRDYRRLITGIADNTRRFWKKLGLHKSSKILWYNISTGISSSILHKILLQFVLISRRTNYHIVISKRQWLVQHTVRIKNLLKLYLFRFHHLTTLLLNIYTFPNAINISCSFDRDTLNLWCQYNMYLKPIVFSSVV